MGRTAQSNSTQPEPIMQSTPAPSDRRISYAQPPSINLPPPPLTPGIAPLLETVDHAIQNTGLQPTALPESMSREDFTRAVAVATVSALRHQEAQAAPWRYRTSGGHEIDDGAAGGGGHAAPSWSRFVSASVLLACTALYAVIAGVPNYISSEDRLWISLYRIARRRGGCCARRIWDRREIPRNHLVRSCAKYHGVYECYFVRSERKYCAQVEI